MSAPARPPGPRGRILVAGDAPATVDFVKNVLTREGYRVETVHDGQEALDRLPEGYDLIIADLHMPKVDGYDLTRRIREDPATRDLPVIIATSADTSEERLRAAEIGASDFIAKPIVVVELQVRARAQLRLKRALDAIKEHETALERVVLARTATLQKSFKELEEREVEIRSAHLETIHRLAAAAEYRDENTSAHLSRMGRLCASLSEWVGLPSEEVEVMLHASVMHDIGKIGIPEQILQKPASLTDEERAVMQQHPVIGAQILGGSTSRYIQAGEVVAISHHERWNGTGYPKGLRGEEIPIFGRICSVADVFDALISKRPYKAAYSVSNSLEIIKEYRGTHFDPRVLDAFLDSYPKTEESLRYDPPDA